MVKTGPVRKSSGLLLDGVDVNKEPRRHAAGSHLVNMRKSKGNPEDQLCDLKSGPFPP